MYCIRVHRTLYTKYVVCTCTSRSHNVLNLHEDEAAAALLVLLCEPIDVEVLVLPKEAAPLLVDGRVPRRELRQVHLLQEGTLTHSILYSANQNNHVIVNKHCSLVYLASKQCIEIVQLNKCICRIKSPHV